MDYYILWQDMSIEDQWFLDEPTTRDGEQIEGWHFTMGRPYDGPLPLICKRYQNGKEMPISFGGLDTPYMRKDLANAVASVDPASVQRIPVSVENATAEYEIVNPIVVVDAIHASSEIERFSDDEIERDPELGTRLKSVWKLVLDRSRIPNGCQVFRLRHSLTDIIVSDEIKKAIEKTCRNHGGKFTPVITA